MALTGKLIAATRIEYTNPQDLATGRFPLDLTEAIPLTSGIGANQADRLFSDERTLAASGTENLDLAGVLTDAFGASLTFARIKGLMIKAAVANTNNVVVGGHATAAFVNWVSDATDKIIVRPGGVFCLYAPDAIAYVVTATTADMLTIANSGAGTSVTYKIAIIGASA